MKKKWELHSSKFIGLVLFWGFLGLITGSVNLYVLGFIISVLLVGLIEGATK